MRIPNEAARDVWLRLFEELHKQEISTFVRTADCTVLEIILREHFSIRPNHDNPVENELRGVVLHYLTTSRSPFRFWTSAEKQIPFPHSISGRRYGAKRTDLFIESYDFVSRGSSWRSDPCLLEFKFVQIPFLVIHKHRQDDNRQHVHGAPPSEITAAVENEVRRFTREKLLELDVLADYRGKGETRTVAEIVADGQFQAEEYKRLLRTNRMLTEKEAQNLKGFVVWGVGPHQIFVDAVPF